MFKFYRNVDLPVFAQVHQNYAPGDVFVQRVSVSADDNTGLPIDFKDLMAWHEKSCYMFTFSYWMFSGNLSDGLSGFKFDLFTVYAYDLKDAMKRFYRYLRLIALGEDNEAAMEVVDNLCHEVYTPSLWFNPDVRKAPRPSLAHRVNPNCWQAPNGSCFATREECEKWMPLMVD